MKHKSTIYLHKAKLVSMKSIDNSVINKSEKNSISFVAIFLVFSIYIDYVSWIKKSPVVNRDISMKVQIFIQLHHISIFKMNDMKGLTLL